MRFLFCILLCLVLVLPLIQAVGISPSKIIVDFQPNFEGGGSYTVINNIGQDMIAEIEVYGELAPYVSPNITSIDVPLGKSADYHFKVKLPEYLEPGLHYARVRVTGVGKTPNPGMFEVRTAVVGKYTVRVPYPGKYIEYTWKFNDIKENETVHFTVEVASRGNLTINEVFAIIDLYDIDYNRITRVTTTKVNSLKTTETGQLFAEWDSTGNKPGVYYAQLTLYYDEVFKEDVRELRIGGLNVKIINYTKSFQPERINTFKVDIESQWNEIIDNVYADISIRKNGAKITTLRTPFETLHPWHKAKLEGFWDTTGYELGEYDVNITVFF
jgi:hypothetical protein